VKGLCVSPEPRVPTRAALGGRGSPALARVVVGMALLGFPTRPAVIPPEVSNKTFRLIWGDTRRHSRRGLIGRSRR
jgi:hypothetical protein